MIEVNQYIDSLIKEYKYKPLPLALSNKSRIFYKNNLPELNNLIPLKDLCGNLVSDSFERVVIGDYGAFCEFSEAQANVSNFFIPKNQKFRLSKGFYGKYIWFSTDGKNKIYKQIKTVSYADYKIGMYYISPYEILNEY